MVADFYHRDFEANHDIWRTGALSASLRRQKVAEWAAAAWALFREDAAKLENCFVSTGFLIGQNQFDDHLIQIPSVPAYDFRN